MNAGCKPYMPPERIEGEKKVAYDVRADVWSLGITLVRTFVLVHQNYTVDFGLAFAIILQFIYV